MESRHRIMFFISIVFMFFPISSCDSEDDESVYSTISFTMDGERVEFVRYHKDYVADDEDNALGMVYLGATDNETASHVLAGRNGGQGNFQSIYLVFPGQNKGTWTLQSTEATSSQVMRLVLDYNGIYAAAEPGYVNIGAEITANVAKFEEVDGRISGTFSGILLVSGVNENGDLTIPDENSATITITDGEFDVGRVADVSIADIPAPL